jgi:hypothetical protein
VKCGVVGSRHHQHLNSALRLWCRLLPLSVARRATAVAESKFFKKVREVLKRPDMGKDGSLERKRQKLVVSAREGRKARWEGGEEGRR